MIINSCCFISNKAIREEEMFFVTEKLTGAIKKALQKGYTNFISSFENTIDLIFADIIVEFMQKNPNITLEASISNSSKLDNEDFLFNRLLNECKTVGITSIEEEDCILERNILMINFSGLIIGIKNENERAELMDYAKKHNKEIIFI